MIANNIDYYYEWNWFSVYCAFEWKSLETKKQKKNSETKNMKLKSFQVVAHLSLFIGIFAWFVENCHFINCMFIGFYRKSIFNSWLSFNRTFSWLNFQSYSKKCNNNNSRQKLKWLYVRSKSNEKKKRTWKNGYLERETNKENGINKSAVMIFFAC